MKKAISLFLALVMLVSVFAGLGITAYAADAQALWVDPVNGSDSAAGTQVAPFQTIEKANPPLTPWIRLRFPWHR